MDRKTKYSATRCSRENGEDMEHRYFQTKAEAMKWVRKTAFGCVRNQSHPDRPKIYEHVSF